MAYQLFLLALLVSIPYVVVYRSQGMWVKERAYREQPLVRFRHEVWYEATTLTTTAASTTPAGSLLTWATGTAYNRLVASRVRIPIVKSREVDADLDGVLDQLEMELHIPLTAAETVTGVRLALGFDVSLLEHAREAFYGLVWLDRISAAGVLPARLDVEGDLEVKQRHAVAHDGDARIGDVTPALNFTATDPAAYDLGLVLAAYHARNLTASLGATASAVWRGGRVGTAPLIVRCVVRYPPQQLWYRPGFWEEVKFGWVQYLAVFVPLAVLLDAFRRFAFDNQLVRAVLRAEKKQA